MYRPRKPRASALYQCTAPQHGLAGIYCDQRRHTCILAFSCNARYFCPSCHQKRMLAYGAWVEANVPAADGAPDAEGGFTVSPPVPRKVLLLRREGLVSEALAEKMPTWRHTGFSAHNVRSAKAPCGSSLSSTMPQ